MHCAPTRTYTNAQTSTHLLALGALKSTKGTAITLKSASPTPTRTLQVNISAKLWEKPAKIVAPNYKVVIHNCCQSDST
jgi:hypothetical protein